MIDTGHYQRMVGAVGLLLVIAFSVYLYVHGGRHAHPGVKPGRELPHFVAPLATSGLDAPANVAPRCDPAHPAHRGLNVCGRAPLVLAFFVPGAKPCIRSVSALQSVSGGFPTTTFAAVAAGAGRRATLALVRVHHWRIPVAYDATAAVAQLYDVVVCPMIEVTGRNGVVRRLLVGKRWASASALHRALTHVLSERR